VSVPDRLTTVARYARALATRGELRDAQAMLEQALEPAATMLGPDHPEVLAATRLLAFLHRELGELSDARRILEEALAAAQLALGDDSSALLPLSYDLATLADELGNRHEARRNFTQLLRHGPAALGPDHEYVRAARRYLGVSAQPAAGPATAAPSGPAGAVPSRPAPQELRFGPPPIYRPDAGPAQTPPARHESVPAPPPLPAPPRLPASPPRLPAPPRPVWSPRGSGRHGGDHRHSRVPLLALVLVAAMALIGGGIAAYLVLRVPGRGVPGRGPVPQASASTAATEVLRPPGDLRLRDNGSSITLTWTDPSKGTVPFIVAGGRAENALNPLGSVEPGKTTYTLNGISPTADFCFLVAAVYSPEHTVPSVLVCTRRTSTPPSPSPSPRR
jgi:hypothetical protein